MCSSLSSTTTTRLRSTCTAPGTMDLPAQSTRAGAVPAAESIGHGSSADGHAERTAQIHVSSGIQQCDLSDENSKPSRKSSFVADVDEVSETAPYGGCECPSLLRFARIYSFLLRTAVFSDPRLAPYRREYFIIIVRATVLIMALMWVCLPM